MEHFNVETFKNQLKWYRIEPQKGSLNDKDVDDLVSFCKSHNISRRGHNIFLKDPKYNPKWIKDLPGMELQKANFSVGM